VINIRRLFPIRSKSRRHWTSEIERQLNYHFKKPFLLEQALTHRSISEGSHRNLERLEFLGDAVLSHVISAHLYQNYRDETEGGLTLRRSTLVSKKFLASVGQELGIHNYLRVNSGVRLNNEKVRTNLVGDAMEALVGAIYLDGGMRSIEKFIRRELLKRYTDESKLKNHKGQLIEYCHHHGLGNPKFHLLDTQGPEHDKQFEVQVRIGPRTFESARANNKKAAEQAAAELALQALRNEISNP
jgi:ribonuclease-3